MERYLRKFNEYIADKILSNIKNLLSDILATLTGIKEYEELNRIRRDFIAFVEGVFASDATAYISWKNA